MGCPATGISGSKAYIGGMLYSSHEMPTVFVIAKDWTLRAAVRAELRELGIDALGMESADDAGRAIAAGQVPSAVVLEAGATSPAMEQIARRVPVIVVASGLERVTFEPVAAILHRPVRVGEIVARVKQALQGTPA